MPKIARRFAVRPLRVRSLMVAVALVAVAITGWKWVVWKREVEVKVEYCRGWGTQHAAEAKEFWKKAADSKLPPTEALDFQLTARRRAIMARKYLAVAADPSLPYPGTPYPQNPLFTPEEIAKEPDQPVRPWDPRPSVGEGCGGGLGGV